LPRGVAGRYINASHSVCLLYNNNASVPRAPYTATAGASHPILDLRCCRAITIHASFTCPPHGPRPFTIAPCPLHYYTPSSLSVHCTTHLLPSPAWRMAFSPAYCYHALVPAAFSDAERPPTHFFARRERLALRASNSTTFMPVETPVPPRLSAGHLPRCTYRRGVYPAHAGRTPHHSLPFAGRTFQHYFSHLPARVAFLLLR